MSLFLVFAICGFLETWALLVMWGFSAGPINAVPFVTLLGGLTLMLVSAPVALFMPRLGSAIAALASVVLLVWPVSIVAFEFDPGGLMFAVPPLVAAAVAAWCLWRTRQARWLTLAPRPAIWVRVVLAAVPFTVFCMVFNARLVLMLVLAGPPS